MSPLASEEAGDIVPLLKDVQALHSAELPERFHTDATDADLYEFLRGWLQRPEILGFVTRDASGTAIGYAIFEIHNRDQSPIQHAQRFGELHHISVTPARQRHGVGRLLMRAVKAELRTRGVTRLRAVHYDFNAASAALMAAEGMDVMLMSREGPV